MDVFARALASAGQILCDSECTLCDAKSLSSTVASEAVVPYPPRNFHGGTPLLQRGHLGWLAANVARRRVIGYPASPGGTA